MNKSGNLQKTIYQIAFWSLFYSFFLRRFWLSTMIPCTETSLTISALLCLVCALPLAVCILYDIYKSYKWEGFSRSGIICGAALLVLIILAGFGAISYELLFLALLVIGARSFRTEEILNRYVISCTVCLVIPMILGVTGLITNLIYSVEGMSRVAFGYIYPTDFCAHIFFFAMSCLFLKGNKIGIKEVLCLGLFGVFAFCICRARNTALCLFLAMLLMCMYVCIRKYREKLLDSKPVKCLGVIAALVAPILAAFMTLSSFFYDYKDSDSILHKLDSLLSRRLLLGRLAFLLYSIKPFGQELDTNGNGGTVDDYLIPDFVYPDLVNIAIVGAVAVFVVLLALLLVKKSKIPLLIGISSVAIVLCFVLQKMLSTNIVVDESLMTFDERILNGMYFFLDCSYLNILFESGWVMLLLVLAVYVAVSFKQLSGKEWVRLLVLALVALQCVFEHHLLDPAYCPFFLCLLTKNEECSAVGGVVQDEH